jgi:hypothetical protein
MIPKSDAERLSVGRFVSLLMLASLVARQFDCCNEGCPAPSCHEHAELSGARMPADFHSSCSLGGRAHTSDADRCALNFGSDDSEPVHPHHLCVASHLVYTSAQRIWAPDPFGASACVSVDPFSASFLALPAGFCGNDAGPPCPSGPARSRLGVYRI